MSQNKNFPIGSIVLMDKIDDRFNFFNFLFENICGKTRNYKGNVKTLIYNKMTYSVSVNQILNIYPEEVFEQLKLKKTPSERSLYRTIERTGDNCALILEKYHQFIKKHDLISNKQFMDWSSSYFEGEDSELGMKGYSRDHRPGKKQITFGISIGMNSIPTALTIQKGNVQDKKHFKYTFKIASKVLDPGSLIIFDCGGKTKQEDGAEEWIQLPHSQGKTQERLPEIHTDIPKEEKR